MGEASRRRRHWGTISEARQEQAHAVAESVDRVTNADRLWFERRPHRSHRVRIMARSEGVQRTAILDKDRLQTPPAGFEWSTVVRQVAPGLRIRLQVFTVIGGDLDGASEDDCRHLFDLAAGTESRRIEAAFRDFERRRSGA